MPLPNRMRRIVVEIETPDDRPKSNVYHPVKWPEDLLADLERLGAMSNPPKAIADVIKECCEYRLTVVKGLSLGYYHLRTMHRPPQSQLGVTGSAEVTPKRP